MDTVSL